MTWSGRLAERSISAMTSTIIMSTLVGTPLVLLLADLARPGRRGER